MASAVDRVRTIPLIVEKGVPMAVDDEDNSGFPFDRDFDREDSFRSQLDDIAQRHPEFAEHLEGFPFRSETLGRRSRPPRPSDESEFRRFAGRPFGSGRFERFGFPFSRDPFEEDFDGAADKHTESQGQPETQQQQKQPEEKRERGRRQNIQQSNTVDLGQKQEPAVNDRNQRSMSAPPPDNRSGQQRYVSSINIPINRDGGIGEAKPQVPPQQPPQQEKPANKPTERVIPIHVEGRDEPVIPKHTGPSFGQNPQPERIFTQSPQPERIFGHRPERFTQFVGREPPRQFATGPEWHHPAYAKQEAPPAETMKPQQQQKFQQQQQQQVPPQKPQEQEQQVPPPQQQQQQPQQPKSSNTPIDLIQSIQKDVSKLMAQVEKFNGVPKDKQYLYLDEMLTRNLIKLDNIDTQGQENIRQARKEAIKCIERCIGILEAKAAANVPKEQLTEAKEEEKMEVENKSEEQQQPQSEAVSEEKPSESQATAEEKMEVEVKEPDNVSEAKGEEKMEAEAQEKTEEKVEPPQQEAQSVVTEEKMEVEGGQKVEAAPEAAAPVVEQPKVEEKPTESSQSTEKVEEKSVDTEMGSTQEGAEAGEEEKKDESSSDDKKDKKKGKKKVVKK